MRLRIKLSNTGNIILRNIQMTESHPIEFTRALQSQLSLISNLSVGQSNVLAFDSGNTCSIQSECGASERCVSNLCLIDISNLVGLITYGATIQANYTSPLGVPLTTQVSINLALNFSQESGVIFRTTSLSASAYGLTGTQVVVDRASDGILEAYTFNVNEGGSNYVPADFISYTPQNNLVYRCGPASTICVSQSTSLDRTISQAIMNPFGYVLGGTLITNITSTEPYRSQNCNGLMPCQERYSSVVAPLPPVCGDGLITGNEICDGTNLGGNDCTTIGMGFTGGTLGCLSCTSWDTSQCTGGGGGFVRFRTTSLIYETSSAIAYTSSCGSILENYGYSTGYSNYYNNCQNSIIARVSLCGTPSQVLASIPGGWLSGSTGVQLWSCSERPGYLYVCDTVGGTESDIVRYYDLDTDAGAVSTSPNSIDPTKEVAC